nr:calponin homology domain-containing protein DDB_G0272472 [Ipomoea batatas]
MDLGCLDMGCIEKKRSYADQTLSHSESCSPTASATATSKAGKNKAMKDGLRSSLVSLNKNASQIRKPPHRKTSPLSWFPRQKVDSYLKRKIKLLQEVDGMNSTLDETLGDSNPHYSRVLREKIAVREAAQKAMEARKAAMVEASWCRILKAARIDNKQAEEQLMKAEKTSDEAFKAATAIGVILYDIPDASPKHYNIETSSAKVGGSTMHTVRTSFETAFEVDKQVASAVKAALINLANCPSINKDEFKELLRKISQNPDTDENYHEPSEIYSEYESDTASELEYGTQKDHCCHEDTNLEMEFAGGRQRKCKKKQVSDKFNMTNLVQMMIERLRCLQEDELASLATIVATCGLNAALAEAENQKHHKLEPASDNKSDPGLDLHGRLPSSGTVRAKDSNVDDAPLPSLDKFLVKRLTRLEREVLEAKNAKRNVESEGLEQRSDKYDDERLPSEDSTNSSQNHLDLESSLLKPSSKFEREIEEAKKCSEPLIGSKSKASNSNAISSGIPDLGSVLVKHSSKLEKEIEKAKKNVKPYEPHGRAVGNKKQDVVDELPSLDKFLVKHVSRLEREVQEAKNRKNISNGGQFINLSGTTTSSVISTTDSEDNLVLSGGAAERIPSCFDGDNQLGDKDDKSTVSDNSLDKILVKPIHRLERMKMQESSMSVLRSQRKHGADAAANCDGLDKILVKHVSRLEKEKMAAAEAAEKENLPSVYKVTRKETVNNEGSLDQVLVRHKSRLEKEKIAAAQQPDDQIRHSVSRREAREKELQQAWGGMSLGNSMRPHLSRLQRDKASSSFLSPSRSHFI